LKCVHFVGLHYINNHESDHLPFFLAIVKQKCDLFSLLYFCTQLYMFRVLTPIIRSSHNFNYSFWYWL